AAAPELVAAHAGDSGRLPLGGARGRRRAAESVHLRGQAGEARVEEEPVPQRLGGRVAHVHVRLIDRWRPEVGQGLQSLPGIIREITTWLIAERIVDRLSAR